MNHESSRHVLLRQSGLELLPLLSLSSLLLALFDTMIVVCTWWEHCFNASRITWTMQRYANLFYLTTLFILFLLDKTCVEALRMEGWRWPGPRSSDLWAASLASSSARLLYITKTDSVGRIRKISKHVNEVGHSSASRAGWEHERHWKTM